MNASRFAVSLACLIVLTTRARAAVTFVPAPEGGLEVIRLTVTPAAAPVPALKYRLLQRDMDLQDGNAAPYYYRAQLELEQTMQGIRGKFDEEKELSQWYVAGPDATPLADLPLKKLREVDALFEPLVQHNLNLAFERSDCDWELNLEDMKGIDIISIRLNEFINSRQIGRLLALRARLAIAEHRYDDAIASLRLQYRLGGDVAKVPFLVCGLIGIAIDSVANQTLVELMASPDSPNMYWALAQLTPRPIDMHLAVRFEMDFGPRLFPFIHNAETTDRSPQEWNRLFAQSLRDLQKLDGVDMSLGGPPVEGADVPAAVGAVAIGLLGYSHAKEQLIAQGLARDRVEAMAVGQVIAIYTERTYQRLADEWEKLWYMPFDQMLRHTEPLMKQLAEAKVVGGGKDREVLPLVALLLPAMQQARVSQVRLERQLAALRVIEALRLYAATHDGKLPAQLSDIDEVPVPLNPATGKPFRYRLEGTTASLELPASDQLNGGNCRYEIEIAAAKK